MPTVTLLVAQPDISGTFPAYLLIDDLQTCDLVVGHPPFPLPDLPFRMFWSARLSEDSANWWIRTVLIAALESIPARVNKLAADIR